MPADYTPELEGGLAWLNTDKPLLLSDLRGQVVILDFWTYCCINCMHVLPVLHDLEVRRAKDPVVVIGIHSAKFEGERDPERIREAMQRYGVTHPVYVDKDMMVWEKFGVSSWPTLVIVRPNGKLAAIAPGEPDAAVLDGFIDKIIAEARADGSLAAGPVLKAAEQPVLAGPLAFPGKVHAATDGRIFVADSGHHRVLILNQNGSMLDTIGSGLQGRRDGSFSNAAFVDPQGLALDGEQLYIADARGHVIVKADLKARTVTTIAGLGTLGMEFLDAPKPAIETGLRSPWALAIEGRRLYFSAAGSHQLGVIELESGLVSRFSGNGREAIIDGIAARASYAQPSELFIDHGTMYVADSETSAIRMVDVESGSVRTLVGRGLFDFGDVDGSVRTAKLQHPLGVAMTGAGLVVADTYNNKLRTFAVDLQSLASIELIVNGRTLAEPGGLAVDSGGALLIADTNHHRLLRVPVHEGRLMTEQAVEVTVQGARPPAQGVTLPPNAEVARPPPGASEGFFSAVLPPTPLGSGARKLVLTLLAPEGYELPTDAPYDVMLEVSRRSDLVQLPVEHVRGAIPGGLSLRLELDVQVDAASPAVDSELVVRIRAVLCDAKNHSACYPLENRLRLPLKLGVGGQDAVFESTLAAPSV